MASHADEIIFRSNEEWISTKDGQETDYQSNYTVLPQDAQEKSLTWESSDETIAVVDKTGHVHILGNGTATITATLKSGAGSSYTLIVTDDEQPPLEDLIIDPESVELRIGDHAHIEYKILPYLSKYSSLYFFSEDPEIAEGDENGVVFGLQVGSTRICVMEAYYGDNGGFYSLTKYFTVNVIGPDVSEEPSEDDEEKPASEETDGEKPASEETDGEKPAPEETDEGNTEPEETDEGKPALEETDEEKPESEEPAASVDYTPVHSDTISGHAAVPAPAVRSVPAWNVEISAELSLQRAEQQQY